MTTKDIPENHEPAPPLGLGSSEGLGRKPTLRERLDDEASLCRNEGADDIARLLDEAATALMRWEAYRAELEDAEKRIGKLARNFIDLGAWEDAGRCALRAEGMKWVRGRMPPAA